MARDISRDELVDELATKHYARLRSQLQAGNADVANDVGLHIAAHMTDDICNEQMAYAVMPNGGRASPRFQKLIEKALELMAETAALAEVEQLERQHAESQNEARAERALSE